MDPADKKTIKVMGEFVKTKKKELESSKKQALTNIAEDTKKP